MSSDLASLLAVFDSIEYLPKTGEARLRTRHGQEVSAPVGAVPETTIAYTRLGLDGTTVELEYDTGERVVLDIPGSRPEPDSRPVVYLDQNHWIELARARVGSPRLRGDRLATYQRFTELAESGAILLPLSAGHFTELGRKSGRQRREVAVTMMKLSRGWQMRHPIQIRQEELFTVFDPEAAVARIFTLTPDALWTGELPELSVPGAGGLAAQVSALTTNLSAAVTLADVLAETAQTHSEEGMVLAERWATSFGDLAQHIRAEPKAKARRRELSLARLMIDMQQELAVAAAHSSDGTTEYLDGWLSTDANAAVAKLPALGRIREVLDRRLANADDNWEPNDLYDILFLSTAAGYSDFVLGERKIGNYLKQASPAVTDGAQVFVRMSDAVPAIESSLQQPAK